MATPSSKEEQLNPVDALMTADEPVETPLEAAVVPETPAEETPAETETETAPEQPTEEPQAPEEPAAPSEPAPPATPEEKVPLAVHLHKVSKVKETARTQLSKHQQRIAELERENETLRASQAQEVDPLVAFHANPENENVLPSKELMQKHDEFVRRDVQREASKPVRPVDLDQALEHANRVIASDPATLALVKMMDGRGLLDRDDAIAIARDPNPKAKFVELARDRFESLGTDQEVAVLNQLFPPNPVTPAVPVRPAATPQVRRTPAVKPAVPPAPPKPKEPTDEADDNLLPKQSRAMGMVNAMFHR